MVCCAIISQETNLTFMQNIKRLNIIKTEVFGSELKRIVFQDNWRYTFHDSLRDHF